MANEEHLELLRQGIGAWNRWRKAEDVEPNLSGADLSGALLEHADLRRTDLRGANLESARLRGAQLAHAKLEGCQLPKAMVHCNLSCVDFSGSDLSDMDLDRVHLDDSHLRDADLSRASLAWATLGGTRLQEANLEGSCLVSANLDSTRLHGANLRSCELTMAVMVETVVAGAQLQGAIFDRTVLANVNLSAAQGLPSADHRGPSTIGTDTIERTLAAARYDATRREECLAFFRGAGVAEHVIQDFSKRPDPRQPYKRTRILYERSEREFARRLYDGLQARGVRCWLEPNDSGTDEWSSVFNRLGWARGKEILCASATAIKSQWAQDAIETALREREDLILVDIDGCLREGWGGEHAGWMRSRTAVDLSRLESDRRSLEETTERLAQWLRARW